MDDPDLPATEHGSALDGLARLNRWSFAPSTLWSAVAEIARAERRPLTLLDVACGGGDLPVALARRARRAGLPLEVSGCDRSPTALAHARALAQRHDVPVRFVRRDVIADALPGSADIVTCSLFLHHLADAEAVALLGAMRDAAKQAVLACDLKRSRTGLLLATTFSRLLCRSPVVHADGPASVRAAFTKDELVGHARRAGLDGARVRNVFPERMMLTWTRPGT
jgi:2-polyprenyl-3-methyl-5-hydroxy-6-metoxy-1,4-benzoquinol methylase